MAFGLVSVTKGQRSKSKCSSSDSPSLSAFSNFLTSGWARKPENLEISSKTKTDFEDNPI